MAQVYIYHAALPALAHNTPTLAEPLLHKSTTTMAPITAADACACWWQALESLRSHGIFDAQVSIDVSAGPYATLTLAGEAVTVRKPLFATDDVLMGLSVTCTVLGSRGEVFGASYSPGSGLQIRALPPLEWIPGEGTGPLPPSDQRFADAYRVLDEACRRAVSL